jgi:coenzyme F420 hydrogenase subunit beta
MQFEVEVELPEKPLKDLKYFGNLKAKVIDSICSHCATCMAVCPVYGITEKQDFPNWEEECIDCGACIRVCPRWDYKPLSGIGSYVELIAARSNRFTGQDGGIATEIMASALEMELVERAVLVGRDDKWKPIAVQIRKVEQLSKSNLAGTKYSFANVMSELRKAVFRAKKGVGVIGTPCIVSGIRRLQEEVQSFKQKVKLVVALFCTENFHHHKLTDFLKDKGVDLSKAVKMDITKGKFIVKMENGEIGFAVKELDGIVAQGCKVCLDFSGVQGDISVGSVGSEVGFSTLVVRSKLGSSIIDYIKKKEHATFGKANLEPIQKLVKFKQKRAKIKLEKNIERRLF